MYVKWHYCWQWYQDSVTNTAAGRNLGTLKQKQLKEFHFDIEDMHLAVLFIMINDRLS